MGRIIALPVITGMAITAVAAAPSATADTAPVPPLPETVSSDPLPTTQMNGVAYAQVANGNKVYVGGAFTSARPAGAALGTGETPRANLLAYNTDTGVLDSSWNPGTDGRVLAASLSPDGSRLYIAGAFTKVAGQNRYRIAAFNTATGALITNWTPGVNSTIYDIKATNTTVYIAGEFTNANNTARTKIAAFSATNGALLPFAPVLDGGYGARALEISPDRSKVVVAGSFLTTNGSANPGRGMAALDSTTGEVLPWAINSVIRNAGLNSAIYSLASDGDSVYGSGYDFGGTKTQDDFEGTFRANWSDGAMQWMEDCHGDSYSVYPMDGVVYQAGHAHYCGNIGEFPQLDPWVLRHSLAFDKQPSDRLITPDIWGYRSFTGQVAGRLLHWYPVWATGTATGIGQAAWDITANDKYLLYGGEFTGVNNVRQQGLVRFAKKNTAPNKMGPSIQGGLWPLTGISFRAGQARVSWQANYDPDNAELTYELFRRNVAAPLYTKSVNSTYWVRPAMSFTDRGLTPGQSYDYRIKATDPFGNSTMSDWTPVTVATAANESAYSAAVFADSPANYWPMGEDSGTASYDWAGSNDLSITGQVTRGVTGPTGADGAKATEFSGRTSYAGATTPQQAPDTFSVEAWFKTSSRSGGKLVGFGDRASGGVSSSYDRHIYLDGSGRVTFGVYPGGVRVIQSATGFNDGQWHHVVGTLGAAGQTMYLDGKRIGTRADTTSGQAYTGFWRVGGDSVSGWPNVGQNYLAGTISDVAVYGSVLTRAQVNAHWVASGRPSTLPAPPADNYGKAVAGLDPALYWRLGETSGSVAVDAGSDESNGTYRGAVALGRAGALAQVANKAAGFGANNAYLSSNRSYSNPSTYAIESWFNTTTTSGGKLVGFGSSNVGLSSNYDRHVYMSPNGRVNFGVYVGGTVVVTTPQAYNDGKWHHVVAQQSAAGMQLFIDGTLVGTDPQTGAQDYTGYWRAGGDNGWDGATYWNGTLDELAVYNQVLTPAQVAQHFDLGAFGAANVAPTAAFTSSPTDLDASFDATASTDTDGTIAKYAWDFGDDSTGEGVTASHSYPAAGTYAVTLTVTDNRGGTDTKTASVIVRAPNQAPTADFTASVSHLTVSLDAGGSADPDGTITDYAWDFGDDSTDQGQTSTHTYSEPGTYTVTLTVTDDRGGKSSKSETVTATAPPANQPPTASFTSSVADLKVSLDASDSVDPDGTIAGYAWKFGDGETGTGVKPAHTYAAGGTYTVELTVTDNDGAMDVKTGSVTVVPANVLPTASFTTSVADLKVAVDASVSTDSDGTITSYAWDFGDGAVAQGAAASHTYAAAGVFTIKLTVTDDRGGVAEKSIPVTVSAPPPAAAVLAKDDFGRTLTNSWGSADAGGAWTVLGGSAAFSVAGGAGSIALRPADTREARLSSVSQTSAVVGLRFASDVASAGGTVSVTLIGRQVGTSVYSSRVRLEPTGVVRMYILRDEVALGSYVLPGTYSANQMLNVRVAVSGTAPTTVRGKVWADGTPEPAWQAQATDTTAALQNAGFVGIRAAAASVSTNPTTRLRIDRFTVTDIP